MIRLNHLSVLIFIFFICGTFQYAAAQKVNEKPYLAVKLMPEKFRKQIKTVNDEFKFAYGMRLDSSMYLIKHYSHDDITNFIHHETDYEKIFRIPFWTAMDSARYCTMLPELIQDLLDTTYVGLTNANDVNIWCRVKTGQMIQNSLNYQIDDDIFKVCGRANWILKRLTKNEFGIIRCNTKAEDIKLIQMQWRLWLNTLKKSK